MFSPDLIRHEIDAINEKWREIEKGSERKGEGLAISSQTQKNCDFFSENYLIVQRGFLSKQYHLPIQSYSLLRRHVVANPEHEHPRYDLLLIYSFGRFRSSPEDFRHRR